MSSALIDLKTAIIALKKASDSVQEQMASLLRNKNPREVMVVLNTLAPGSIIRDAMNHANEWEKRENNQWLSIQTGDLRSSKHLSENSYSFWEVTSGGIKGIN